MMAYGNATYAYAANGELQAKTIGGAATSYTYDALGNLLDVTPPTGSAVDYVIDGMNPRVGRKVGGTLVQGLLNKNQLNSVAELDGSRNLVAQYVYGTKPNVADLRIDAAGYDSVSCRWSGKDPILFGGGQLNIYVYAANDPVNLIDWSGLDLYYPGQPVPPGGCKPGDYCPTPKNPGPPDSRGPGGPARQQEIRDYCAFQGAIAYANCKAGNGTQCRDTSACVKVARDAEAQCLAAYGL